LHSPTFSLDQLSLSSLRSEANCVVDETAGALESSVGHIKGSASAALRRSSASARELTPAAPRHERPFRAHARVRARRRLGGVSGWGRGGETSGGAAGVPVAVPRDERRRRAHARVDARSELAAATPGGIEKSGLRAGGDARPVGFRLLGSAFVRPGPGPRRAVLFATQPGLAVLEPCARDRERPASGASGERRLPRFSSLSGSSRATCLRSASPWRAGNSRRGGSIGGRRPVSVVVKAFPVSAGLACRPRPPSHPAARPA
jgi:hypothetical protein